MSGKFARVAELPHHKLSDAVLRIVDLLYFDDDNGEYDPNKEWTQSTIEDVDSVLIDTGLRPDKKYNATYQNLPWGKQSVDFMVVFDGYPPRRITEKVPPDFVSNDDRVEWFRVHRFSSPVYRKKHHIDLHGPCYITSTVISGLTGDKK